MKSSSWKKTPECIQRLLRDQTNLFTWIVCRKLCIRISKSPTHDPLMYLSTYGEEQSWNGTQNRNLFIQILRTFTNVRVHCAGAPKSNKNSPVDLTIQLEKSIRVLRLCFCSLQIDNFSSQKLIKLVILDWFAGNWLARALPRIESK